MIHVPEHVADPVAMLAGLRELLAPGGPVYIDVPDVAVDSSLKDLHIAHVHHSSATTPGRPSRPPGSTCCASTRTGRLPSLRALAASGTPRRPAAFACDATGWAAIRRINRQRFNLALKRAVRRWRGRGSRVA